MSHWRFLFVVYGTALALCLFGRAALEVLHSWDRLLERRHCRRQQRRHDRRPADSR